jgi:trimethylamine:corrinoid methyltransferase-like protein
MSRERKRKGRAQSQTIKGIQQQPWKQPRNRYAPFEIASADQIEAIHLGSLRILR